jgi:hypothetical protein
MSNENTRSTPRAKMKMNAPEQRARVALREIKNPPLPAIILIYRSIHHLAFEGRARYLVASRDALRLQNKIHLSHGRRALAAPTFGVAPPAKSKTTDQKQIYTHTHTNNRILMSTKIGCWAQMEIIAPVY